MTTLCCCHVTTESATGQVLGLTKARWRVLEIKQILVQFDIPFCERSTKAHLLYLLEVLARERNLTRQDRLRLLDMLHPRLPSVASPGRHVEMRPTATKV